MWRGDILVDCVGGRALKEFIDRTIMGGLSEWKGKRVSAVSERIPALGTEERIDRHRVKKVTVIVEASSHFLVLSPFGFCVGGLPVGCPESHFASRRYGTVNGKLIIFADRIRPRFHLFV
jgi:hypothetical protein